MERLPAQVLLLLLAASAPCVARAQSEVTITVRVDASPGEAARSDVASSDGPRLALVEPGDLDREAQDVEDASLGVLVGSLVTGLSLTGLGAVIAETPGFGATMPDWAAATLGLSAPMGALGLLAVGGSLAVMMGADPASAFTAVGIAEVLLGVCTTMLLLAVSPETAAPWGDPFAQQRVTDILAAESLSLLLGGLLGVAVGVAGMEPEHGVDVAPIAGDGVAGMRASGRL